MAKRKEDKWMERSEDLFGLGPTISLGSYVRYAWFPDKIGKVGGSAGRRNFLPCH